MNKFLFILGSLLIVTGIALYWHSLGMELHNNSVEYYEKLYALERGDNAGFHQLKHQYLSDKNEYEDYGITMGLLGVLIIFISRIGYQQLKYVPHRAYIISAGVLAVFIGIWGLYEGILNGVERGTEPPWDNFAPPLMGMPILAFFAFMWMILNYVGCIGDFTSSKSVIRLRFRNFFSYYGILVVISTLFTILMIAGGAYWWGFSGLLWLYFYFSILAGRKTFKWQKRQLSLENTPAPSST